MQPYLTVQNNAIHSACRPERGGDGLLTYGVPLRDKFRGPAGVCWIGATMRFDSAMSASTRGRPPRRLSLERIVDEALALVDEQGIAAASMRSVGERLGVKAMSLYRYISSREHMLDLVVERIVDELSADDEVHMHPTDGWRDYLDRLARGVRRYALAHPHAFPLVATRPTEAPWVNPPLRSMRWIEAMLRGLHDEGLNDEQVVFTYRVFNSFLLGFLLLETSAMALRDPKPGDGSFQQGPQSDGSDPVDPGDPIPGALTPARSARERKAIDRAETDDDAQAVALAPSGGVSSDKYPFVYRLQAGLTEDHYGEEFDTALGDLLDRVDRHIRESAPKPRPRRKNPQR
jgi:TetR/AcrR family tetracycline transcriptional repressor